MAKLIKNVIITEEQDDELFPEIWWEELYDDLFEWDKSDDLDFIGETS